jgi:hypothetical protein
MTRKEAKAAILAAVPALLMAGAAWLQADAAKKSETKTYYDAADSLGDQADEIMELRARIVRLEHSCSPSSQPGLLITGNTFGPPGVANIITR